MIIAVVGTMFITPQFEASSKLRVPTAARGSIDWVDNDLTYTDRLMNTYLSVANTGPVKDQLMAQLGLAEAPEYFVEILANTELMQISVQDADPELAMLAANALAQIMVGESESMSSGRVARETLNGQITEIEADLDSARAEYDRLLAATPQDTDKLIAVNRTIEVKRQVYADLLANLEKSRVLETMQSNTLSIIEPATLPEAPISPNPLLNFGVGLLLGIIGGLGLSFLTESLDTKVYSESQVESVTDAMVLGAIPRARKQSKTSFVDTESPEGEAFRRLRTNVLTIIREQQLRSLMITSAHEFEGKSSVVSNLALVLSHVGVNIIVVDCNLRKPMLHEVFGVSNYIGLSNVLRKQLPLERAIQYGVVPGIPILTSGMIKDHMTLAGSVSLTNKLSPHPAELLSTPQMGEVLKELQSKYDLVLIDTPSVLDVSDTAILASLVDGVLLVASKGISTTTALSEVCQQLHSVKASVLGVVMNYAQVGSSFKDISKSKPSIKSNNTQLVPKSQESLISLWGSVPPPASDRLPSTHPGATTN
ncbi:MAG: polysaccharide biosynthesis tyrosine autokinase [Caldilineaceae bacterium]